MGLFKKKNATTPVSPKRKKKRRIVLIILASLLVIRLILPYVILHFANKKLATLDGYYGHIDDIDLAIIRGAYKINDIYLHKLDDSRKDTTDFFSCSLIDLSVEWSAIFDGKLVGEVEFDYPSLLYTIDKSVGKKADKDTTDLIQLIRDFMPLDINRFDVVSGDVHYIDPGRSPKVDVPLTAVNIHGRGLTNHPEPGVVLPATIDMDASLFEGSMTVGVKLDPLNESPTFDLNATLTETHLVNLNDFFQAYANFDLKEGTMEMYTEVAAKENEFAGYIKPLVANLDIVQFEKEEGNILQIAWEAFVGTAAEVFQNQRTEELATKVDFNGKFTNPDVQVFDAILAVLRNAFIKALEPSIEHTISLQTVDEENEEKKGFLKRLFDGKEETDEGGSSTSEKEKPSRKERREQRKKDSENEKK